MITCYCTWSSKLHTPNDTTEIMMKVETFVKIIAMIVIAAAALKEVDSQCLVACPDNGCTHDPDSGWVDTVHKHVHFDKDSNSKSYLW